MLDCRYDRGYEGILYEHPRGSDDRLDDLMESLDEDYEEPGDAVYEDDEMVELSQCDHNKCPRGCHGIVFAVLQDDDEGGNWEVNLPEAQPLDMVMAF